MKYQLYCKCFICDPDPLLCAKVPIWTANEYRSCEHYETACISFQCLDNEFSYNNCFLVLKAVDIDCDDGEDFMQIFEDGGVAAASNSVSKLTEAVISMESSTVLEEIH